MAFKTTRLLVIAISMYVYSSSDQEFGRGTTPNLKEIFIGKCYDYQNVINPGLFTNGQKDCSALYVMFVAGFMNTGPCGARREDFTNYTEYALHSVPKDKIMFWEGVYDFVYKYTDLGRRFTGISDTLTGYPMNGLHWCSDSHLGHDISLCPQCQHSSEMEFWRQTSIAFAESAVGVAHVMLNGTSSDAAFSNSSTFAQYELKYLDPSRITLLHALLVHDIGKPIKESCGTGSLVTLERLALARGLNFKCTDDPRDVRFLQCVDHPYAVECQETTTNTQHQGASASLVSLLATAWSTMHQL